MIPPVIFICPIEVTGSGERASPSVGSQGFRARECVHRDLQIRNRAICNTD